jgi:glycosyltransferase involved in cell wall biosynthesis
MDKLSVVLPIHNEEESVVSLLEQIEQAVEGPVEVVLVDDGSSDNTLQLLRDYRPKNPDHKKTLVVLSRNFGHQHALMAGLSAVAEDSEAVLVMDADLQDDPKNIPILIEKLREGYDCVYAVRGSRREGILMRICFSLFYVIQSRIASFPIPRNAGTFSVFKRCVLEAILRFEETDVYFPALRAYVGYRQEGVSIERAARAHGRSRVGFAGLVNLSIAGLLGFSGVPLRLIFAFGVFVTLSCMFLSLVVFVMKIVGITKIPGVTTTLIVTMTLSGIQIMFMGIVGEYLGRLLRESKKRPRWVVREIVRDG